MSDGIWRNPAEETSDYPKLWVRDGRKSGSITIGQSRLPIWAVLGDALSGCDDTLRETWETGRYDFGERDLMGFLSDLLAQRGEFARLLCVLAGAMREYDDDDDRELLGPPWWERPETRRHVLDALDRCRAVLADAMPTEGANDAG